MSDTTTTTTPQQDNTKLPLGLVESCPVHGSAIRKVYTFGATGDAEVTTFAGCACATAQQFDPCGILPYHPRYFTNYAAAAGLAKLVKACNQDTWGGAL